MAASWPGNSCSCLLAGCGFSQTDDSPYTLYRDSVSGESMRVHVATFDAAENDQYNRSNCAQAQNLFQHQRSVKTRFWCEKGRFKK